MYVCVVHNYGIVCVKLSALSNSSKCVLRRWLCEPKFSSNCMSMCHMSAINKYMRTIHTMTNENNGHIYCAFEISLWSKLLFLSLFTSVPLLLRFRFCTFVHVIIIWRWLTVYYTSYNLIIWFRLHSRYMHRNDHGSHSFIIIIVIIVPVHQGIYSLHSIALHWTNTRHILLISQQMHISLDNK